MRESVIEKYLKDQVKRRGGEVRKLAYQGRRGAPDRQVLLNGRHPLVELKAPGVKPEVHQLREHDRLRAAGLDVYVIDSIEGVDALIRKVMRDE